MHRKRRWVCVCSCGAQTTAYQWSLLAGRSRSCGCLKSEEQRLKSAELNERQGNENHGMHSSTEYKCWLLLKNRCYNPNSKDYAYAGARGVRVCERWRSSFQSFYDDMGARPPLPAKPPCLAKGFDRHGTKREHWCGQSQAPRRSVLA
jgi:hypothetical protein